jgi:signal transduction histidine kinase
VANAQRFSPDGGTVRVRVLARANEATAWTVSDDGPGISDSDQQRLFERFFVGRSDRSGAREGIGLGLPTALAIAQAHGGTIEVDSQVGRGSTFTLVVPNASPDDEA